MNLPPIHTRPLEPSDLEPLLALYVLCFPGAARRPRDEARRKLGQLFIDGPLCDPTLPSLVACDEAGALVGFRGRVRRWWRFGSERVLGSTTTHVMVRGDLRRAGIGSALRAAGREIEARTGVLSGVGFSDRTTTDGRAFSANNEQLIRLEQFGFNWRVPVRRLGLTAGRARSVLGARLAEGGLRSAGLGLAALGARALPAAPRLDGPELRSGPLSASALQEAVAAAGEGRALRLDEPVEILAWLLDYLRDYPSRGRFVGRVWLGDGGSPVGFYAGYRSDAGDFELLGFGVRPELEEVARRQVLRDARAEGALFVTGNASARELRTLIGLGARVEAGARAGLRSSREDVAQRFQAMDVLVTGLEGERWL